MGSNRGFIMLFLIVMIALVSVGVFQGYRNVITANQIARDRVFYAQQYYLNEAVCNAGIQYVKKQFGLLIEKSERQTIRIRTELTAFNKDFAGQCVISKVSGETLQIKADLLTSGHVCSSIIACLQRRPSSLQQKETFFITEWNQYGKNTGN
ncbi:hypothetical protein HOM50_05480 [bacterium]|jgi:hypothetical protein|nr:hypothetical protein [bacterium]MBT5015830.1 hypothetical protein [bacterium]